MLINVFSHIFSTSIKRNLYRNASFQCDTFLPIIFSCHECFQVRRLQSQKQQPQLLTTEKEEKSKIAKKGQKLPEVKELLSMLKERSKKKVSFVFDSTIAKKLVDSVVRNRVGPKAPIIELSPGIGLVSREFLNRGVQQVVAVEMDKAFHPHLQLIKEEYGDLRFDFHSWDMLNIFNKFNTDQEENRNSYKMKEAEVLKSLSSSCFIDTETPYSLFSIGGSYENHNLIFYILRNLPNEDPLLSKGRVEFFLLVHPKLKLSIERMFPTDQPSRYTRYYSYIHTFMCLLYDMEFLDEFESNGFVPVFSKRSLSKTVDPSKRYLMRLQLKSDIATILPLDQHYAFSIFLRHVYRKRKARVIPVMEMLVSGCGLRMMVDGFSMMETVINVSPQRLLQLYKNMLNWPEYSESHLKNHIMMKTQGGPMEEEEMD